MQIKHSAIREYSDHLITFQSGLPHVSHQSLQDKKPGSSCEGGWSPPRSGALAYTLTCRERPLLDAPAQGSVLSSVKGLMVSTEGA